MIKISFVMRAVQPLYIYLDYAAKSIFFLFNCMRLADAFSKTGFNFRAYMYIWIQVPDK